MYKHTNKFCLEYSSSVNSWNAVDVWNLLCPTNLMLGTVITFSKENTFWIYVLECFTTAKIYNSQAPNTRNKGKNTINTGI
jgi:hypothetical protein